MRFIIITTSFIIDNSIFHTVVNTTSNVTGHHRGSKQKLQAGDRAPSLKWTFYLASASVTAILVFIIKCGISRFLCAMHVFDLWTSSSSHRLSLCQILFLRALRCLKLPPLPLKKNSVLNQ